jgi:hypothetical protein
LGWLTVLHFYHLPAAAPEQRSNKALKPALVWAEICSFLKGSAEAVANEKVR